MKIGVVSAGLEYGITVTALFLPSIFLGFLFVNFMNTAFSGVLEQVSRVAIGN